jgi:hypothetical protein
MSDWNREEWRAIDLRARFVPVPSEVGVETERVPLSDVLARRVFFPEGGIFIMRCEDEAVYVGLTNKPLRQRVLWARSKEAPWTRVDYLSWTVTMQRAPEWPADKAAEERLIADLQPRYNVRGRPRKAKTKPATGRCGGTCPACGALCAQVVAVDVSEMR